MAQGPDAGQPRLKVEYVATGELVPYEGNAKEHPDWQVREICESIKSFGFGDPVGAWHDRQGRAVIVEGHGRLLAAKQLDMGTVPVIWLDHLDDEGRRAYGLVHNQLTMDTPWDQEALDTELESLNDIDMSDFGFDGTSTGDDVSATEDDGGKTATLAERFGIPPFSVIDARKGAWAERKRAWIGLGIRSELGRGAAPGGAPMPLNRAGGGRRLTYNIDAKASAYR